MSMESWTATLHPGLIQRARSVVPGTTAPLRERDRFARAPAPLRESAIVRARGSLAPAPEREECCRPSSSAS